MSNYDFIKKVEQLIKPKDIATLQSLAPFTKFIPRKIQNKIMAESGKKNPYMGFVGQPGHSSEPKSEADMVEQVRQLDLENMPDYSADPLWKMIKRGMLFNSLLILALSLLSTSSKRKKPKN